MRVQSAETNHNRTMTTQYPTWICWHCGDKYGNRPCGVATWHPDTCDICGLEDVAVTEPRDFGHLRDGWQNQKTTTKP